MPAPFAIPAKFHRNVLHWYLNGGSPREIAKRLREQGVTVQSHVTVRNLLDRIAAGRSHVSTAAVTARLRVKAGTALDEMECVKRRVIKAARKGASQTDIDQAKDQLPLLREAHRMAALHLKMSGVGSQGRESTLAIYGSAVQQFADLENAKDGISWPFVIDQQGGAVNFDRANPGGASEFKLNTLREVARRLNDQAPPEAEPVPELPAVSVASSAKADPVAGADEPPAAANNEPIAPAPATAVGNRQEPFRTAVPDNPVKRAKDSGIPGRNGPCPCGSGEKFKRCCIDRPFLELMAAEDAFNASQRKARRQAA